VACTSRQLDKQTGLVSVEGIHAENWDRYVGLSYGYYDTDGKLVRVGSTGQTGPKEEMERFVGFVGSYKSYGRVNETGALNHPVFLEWRDDKDADCDRYQDGCGETLEVGETDVGDV
jgi:hypothetical protein